ncbi:hypothetical protein ACVL92_009213, partial [Bradyrhizobium liaoningense]
AAQRSAAVARRSTLRWPGALRDLANQPHKIRTLTTGSGAST